jgi:hypothetical protein
MLDHGAVWDHFASAIGAYRKAAQVENWKRISLDVRQLGEYAVFATVHWKRARHGRAGSPGHMDELPPAFNA